MPAMDEIKLSLSQAGPSGELSVIRVDGVVDTITASELESVIGGLITQKRYKILVDLGGVEYISSAGWGIFISRIQEIRDHAGDLKLVNMVPNVYEIYELLEFENIIPSFESLEQGKRSFNIAQGNDITENRIWKADERIFPEPPAGIQSAMAPGGRRGGSEVSLYAPGRVPAVTFHTDEEVILHLVVEDPFSSIAELAEQAEEIAPQFRYGWWRVFAILRRNKLLGRRARFRLARRRNRER